MNNRTIEYIWDRIPVVDKLHFYIKKSNEEGINIIKVHNLMDIDDLFSTLGDDPLEGKIEIVKTDKDFDIGYVTIPLNVKWNCPIAFERNENKFLVVDNIEKYAYKIDNRI